MAGQNGIEGPGAERSGWMVEFDTRRGFSAFWKLECDREAAWRRARRVSLALGWTLIAIS